MFRAAYRGIPLSKWSHCHRESKVSLFSISCIYQISVGSYGRFLIDTPATPNLIQGSCCMSSLAISCGATRDARALQHNRTQPAGTARDLQEHHPRSEHPCNRRQENLRHVQRFRSGNCREASPVPSLSRCRQCFSHILWSSLA